MTEAAIRDRSKTVTRRIGWNFAEVGQELRAVRKVMGRKKDEPIVDLARIRIVSVRREPLSKIDQADVVREGYPHMSPERFVRKFCKALRCEPGTEVARIEFEYID